jgi:dolichol kinase
LLAISSLLVLYPLRLLHNSPSATILGRFKSLAIPVAFEPAPILYPTALTMLVVFSLAPHNPTIVVPNLVLSISSLPSQLLPSFGASSNFNLFHWLISCLPLIPLRVMIGDSTNGLMNSSLTTLHSTINGLELMTVLYPLHQALCTTLHFLTTTSLLPAELQLLSIALINLLYFSSSPQAVILQALIWIGGVTMILSCSQVLRWGVALARVPKWRFRRPRGIGSQRPRFSISRLLRDFLLVRTTYHEDTSDDGSEPSSLKSTGSLNKRPPMVSSTEFPSHTSTLSDSALEREGLLAVNGNRRVDSFNGLHDKARHNLPAITQRPRMSNKRTPSGRKKRSSSSSIQAFCSLTPTQATIRKWIYAAYVYICILAIILFAIREYVSQYALAGQEPIGWALGYMFGDLPWFRLHVVTANLERWICLPQRNYGDSKEFCHLGWVQHLRQVTFGGANTRLILCGYWICIIITGIAVVFRLSAIYEVDTRRKVFHFMMVAMLLPSTYVDPTFVSLALSLVLAIFLLLDLFRASQLPPLSKPLAYFLTPYVDGRDLRGPVVISHIFLLIGCAIPLWLSLAGLPRTGTGYLAGWEVPTREVSMVSGVICVGLGDAAASLVGRRYGRHKWIWSGGKSIEGSIAFAIAVATALIAANAWLRLGAWPANNNDAWFTTAWKAALAASLASLNEAVLTGGNDNVVVPVVLWLSVRGLKM